MSADEFCEVQKRRSTDFDALKSLNVRPGSSSLSCVHSDSVMESVIGLLFLLYELPRNQGEKYSALRENH